MQINLVRIFKTVAEKLQAQYLKPKIFQRSFEKKYLPNKVYEKVNEMREADHNCFALEILSRSEIYVFILFRAYDCDHHDMTISQTPVP